MRVTMGGSCGDVDYLPHSVVAAQGITLSLVAGLNHVVPVFAEGIDDGLFQVDRVGGGANILSPTGDSVFGGELEHVAFDFDIHAVSEIAFGWECWHGWFSYSIVAKRGRAVNVAARPSQENVS